jgi:hypothetical protein
MRRLHTGTRRAANSSACSIWTRSPAGERGGCSPRHWKPRCQDYLDAATSERDEAGRALLIRNGHATEREVVRGAGAVEVRAPRVDDRRLNEDGNRKRFKSVILPPYMRRSPKVIEVLPLLYLHGLSSGDFVPALEGFFGTEAGLSSPTIARLTERWRAEHESFQVRDLSGRDYLYVWVDGIHTGVRLGGDDRLCCLVMVGGAARWDQGAGSHLRRLPGVRGELGAVPEGPQTPRDESTGVGRRRRCSGLLECSEGRLPTNPTSAGLGPQNLQRARLHA